MDMGIPASLYVYRQHVGAINCAFQRCRLVLAKTALKFFA